jgi:hypothetical protein
MFTHMTAHMFPHREKRILTRNILLCNLLHTFVLVYLHGGEMFLVYIVMGGHYKKCKPEVTMALFWEHSALSIII